MWLSAIVPLVFCRFWKPHCAEEVLPKFSIDSIMFFFKRRASRSRAGVPQRRSTLPEKKATLIVFLAVVGLPAPHRLATAPTCHGPASLTPLPPKVKIPGIT
jgi:hypothetical protein